MCERVGPSGQVGKCTSSSVNKKHFAYDVKCSTDTFWGTLTWDFF